jgi:hypothetical protein
MCPPPLFPALPRERPKPDEFAASAPKKVYRPKVDGKVKSNGAGP